MGCNSGFKGLRNKKANPFCVLNSRASRLNCSGGIAPHILHSALDGSEWSVSLPGRLIPRERTIDFIG